MEDSLQQIANILEKNANQFDWTSAISAFCSLVSLIAIGILLKERYERKRPYIQVSFELIRDCLVCIIIKNVGEVPAKILNLRFDEEFTKQIPEEGQNNLSATSKTKMKIFPNQKWVITLSDSTFEVMEYKKQNLLIDIEYIAVDKPKKVYNESEEINFEYYRGFLQYISGIDELKNEIGKLGKNITNASKSIVKSLETSDVKYSNLEDDTEKRILSNKELKI